MRKNDLQKLNDWKQHTKRGLLLTSIIEWGIAYGLASWGLDSGSWWVYLFTFLFFIGAVKNTVNLIRMIFNGKPKTSPARRAKK